MKSNSTNFNQGLFMQWMSILKTAIKINGIRQLVFYLSNVDVYRFIEYSKTFQHLEDIQNKRILDLGSGYSVLPCLVPVISTDITKNACEWQKNNCKSEAIICDICALPVKSESIDIVTAISSVEHVPNDLAVYEEINRILQKDGYLLMSVPYSAIKGAVIKGLRNRLLVRLLNSKNLEKFWKVLLSQKHYNYFKDQTKTDFLEKRYSRDELYSIINSLGLEVEEEFIFGKYLIKRFFKIFPAGWFVIKDLILGYILWMIEIRTKTVLDGNGIWLKIVKSRE